MTRAEFKAQMDAAKDRVLAVYGALVLLALGTLVATGGRRARVSSSSRPASCALRARKKSMSSHALSISAWYAVLLWPSIVAS